MVCVGVLTLEPCRHHPLLTWLLSRRGQNRSGQGWISKRIYMGSPVKTKFRHELASKQSLDMDPLGIYIYNYIRSWFWIWYTWRPSFFLKQLCWPIELLAEPCCKPSSRTTYLSWRTNHTYTVYPHVCSFNPVIFSNRNLFLKQNEKNQAINCQAIVLQKCDWGQSHCGMILMILGSLEG